MKLVLSLSLIWMLSSTAAAGLQCLSNDSNKTVLQSCKSEQELCATVAVQVIDEKLETIQNIMQACVPSFFCNHQDQIFSYNDGFLNEAASYHCCNTDGCNSQHVPYLDVLKEKNGLQCVSCADHQGSVCNKTVECVGVQDRCIKTVDNDTSRVLGCASANFCEAHLQMGAPGSITEEVTCCRTSFCNSARAVKLSVVPVLLGVVALIAY